MRLDGRSTVQRLGAPLVALSVVTIALPACDPPPAEGLSSAPTATTAVAVDPLADRPAEELVDGRLFARAPLVVRARLLVPGEGSKILTCQVAVERVLKNATGVDLTREVFVGYVKRPGVPRGHSTLYLEPWGESAWKLIDHDDGPAISHPADQPPSARDP